MKEYITFEAKGQYLAKTGGIDAYASDTIEYIEAHFETDWNDYDIIQAIWSNGTAVATVIDSLGNCVVPSEVLNTQSRVYVNLVASDIVNDEVVERLTSYPVEALMVNVKVPVDGSTPSKVTPSQFEQFVEVVKADADRAESGAESAEQSAINAEESERNAKTSEGNSAQSEANALQSERNAKQSEDNAKTSEENSAQSAIEAEEWADKAEQSASDAGFMEFYIDEHGHLIMEHTQSVDTIDFDLVNGHLILEVA